MRSRNLRRKSCRPCQGTILCEACPYRPQVRVSAYTRARVRPQRHNGAERETIFRLYQGRRVWQHAFLVRDQPVGRNWTGGVPLHSRTPWDSLLPRDHFAPCRGREKGLLLWNKCGSQG